MNIAIVGTGYVGLVTGTCFAETGANVTCVDVNEEKIENLKKGIIPIYEPGLESMVERNVKAGRLHFTTSLVDCLDDVQIVFSAVGTPPDEDGSADLKYVLDVARTIGKHIDKYTLVVTKSTVPVGTAKKVKAVIQEELDKLAQGRTTLIVAHRFSTIRNAHRILVFDHGRIVGDGPHAELYENCPLYRELYDRQGAVEPTA